MPRTIQLTLSPRLLGSLVAAALCLGLGAPAQAQDAAANSPVGTWQTLDEQTGQAKALIEITQQADGTLSGKVIKEFKPNDGASLRCIACSDARKDQLVQGMTIIDGMKHNGDDWDGGHILDPESGKVYTCLMHIEDGGKTLIVRGYIGTPMLGRSKTWHRA